MKKVLYSIFLSAILILQSSCSFAPPAENNSVAKQSPATNRQNVNTQPIQNGSIIEPPVAVGNNADFSESNTPMNVNRTKKSIESNSTEKPKIIFTAAPYNSSYATTMGDDGEFIQIRIFNADDKIRKMEKRVTANKIKVFLKNDKVLDVPADKQFDFINASPQDILIAVGVLQKPDSSQTGAK